MKVGRPSKILVLGCLLLPVACARGDVDSESHFVCAVDADCAGRGLGTRCVASRCAAPELGPRGTSLQPLEFSACPLVVTQPLTPPPAGPLPADQFDGRYSPIGEWLAISGGVQAMSSAMAECATARMPAVWEEPEGESIEVFVKRYPAAEQPARGQLWMVDGGPGVPSSTLEQNAFFMGAANPTLDVYLPDHRGTGRSTFAKCPSDLSPLDCPAAIPHLDGLTATDAARDVAALIDATRASPQQVFVYGVGYATHWVQRYLQIRPNQPTAVILDSVVPVGMDSADFNRDFDGKARAILALCQDDATCASKVGPDPLAKAQQALGVPLPVACGGGLVRRLITDATGGNAFDRLLLPAVVHRALRCEEADQAWLDTVRAHGNWFQELFTAGVSQVVQNNIIVSEFWHTDTTAEDVWREGETLLTAEGSPVIWADAAAYWPRYARDAYHGDWPSTPAPILVLQGGLDPRTPYGDVVKAQYSGAGQYYVEVPSATNGVLSPLMSPMADLAAPGCGFQVVQSFLADPTKAPDTSCIAGTMPIDWSNPPPEWMALVGIEDLWESP